MIVRELIRVLKRILTKEVMLEPLTYEPFGKFLPEDSKRTFTGLLCCQIF